MLFSIIGYSNCIWSQQRITLDDMRQRYAEFMRQGADTTINRQNDEVVSSSYYVYNKKGKRYNNPRQKGEGRYAYMLTERLRTPEYPDKRHYWSLIDYERVNHRTFKRPIRPVEHRRLKYKEKSFVRYLALDSIEGTGPDKWSKAFRRKYYHRKHKFHYAKAVSDSLFLLTDVRNMLGYTVSPTFRDVQVNRGSVKGYDKSGERCEQQMGELMHMGPLMLDGGGTYRNLVTRRWSALNDIINKSITVRNTPTEHKVYDLLIIMLPDGRTDAEVLSCSGETGPEFEQLRQAIRQLPPRFFVRYWTVDGHPLPGCYIESIINPNGTWSFSMNKFLLNLVGHIW